MHAFPLEPTTADRLDSGGRAPSWRHGRASVRRSSTPPSTARRCATKRSWVPRREMNTVSSGALNHEVDGEGGGPRESGAPWPPPVSGEKYSKKPAASTSSRVRGAARRRARARPCPQALDDDPVRVHPGRALPVALLLELRRVRAGRSGTGKRASPRGVAERVDQLRAACRGAGRPEREEGRDGRVACSGSRVTASREQYWPVGSSHSSSSARRVRVNGSWLGVDRGPRAGDRSVTVRGGDQHALNADVLDQHRPRRAGCAARSKPSASRWTASASMRRPSSSDGRSTAGR